MAPSPAARLAVDIGGTFTDLALEHDGRRSTIKVLTTPPAPEQGVMAGVRDDPAEVRRRAGRHRHRDPRHHARHQRGDRAQGRAHRAADHRGLPRRDRDGQREPLRPVRPEHRAAASRWCRAICACRCPNGWTTKATCCCRWTRPRCARWCRCCERESVESIAVGFLHAFVNPAHERRVARHPGRAAAGHSGIAVQRSLAGDARVGALLHHRRQRLRAAADGALSAPAGGRAARHRRHRRRCS